MEVFMAEGSLKKWNKGLNGIGNFISHFLLLAIRLYWGVLFIKAGFTKVTDFEAESAAFANIGLPFPAAMVIIVTIFEILGGISWILGLFTRLFAIPLFGMMAVAYLTVFYDTLTGIFTNPSAFTAAEPFLFLFASLILFCFGPGYISFDYKLGMPKKEK